MPTTRSNLISVADIAQLVKGELIGDGSLLVTGFSGIKEANKTELTFLSNLKYEPLLGLTQAGAILVPRQIVCPGKTLIKVDNPSLSFTQVINHFLKDEPDYRPQGIHPTAVIALGVKLGANVAVGPHAVIEDGAIIEDGSVIHANVYIGHEARLGKDCLIYPNVVLREKVFLGNRVIVHSGTVIGSDGYGYVTVEGRHMKIPQIGTVVIEDDVEIGANVAIDRARFDKTIIGEGTKIDNLVHIAHNVVIGKHCFIVGQVGISGSTRIGNYVILAGQVGVVGHLEIGDGVVVTAQSGVSRSIKAGEQVFGSPAQPVKIAFRNNAHVQRLDKYVEMIKDLKKRVEELENKGVSGKGVRGMKQKTIKNPVTLSGIGLHTGKSVKMTIKPAQDNDGISFIRVDLPNRQQIKVTAANAVLDEKVTRCTAVEAHGVRIYTVEHLLAALSGLGIDNVSIEIDAEEVPGLDGSSLEFVKSLQLAGVVEQQAEKNIFAIQEPIIVSNKTSTLVMVPHDQFNVSYTLDYDHPLLRSQFFSQSLNEVSFIKELAPARTFCLETEASEIRAHGLARGANYQNTLVMSNKGPVENALRFPDECVRHKVLDIVGDLFLLGYPVKGAIYATKSGHSLNRAMVKKIEAQRQKQASPSSVVNSAPGATGRVFNIDDIMKILPHRYPFLFVDRVIEIEPGKKGIGIKNVTVNDGFFQGHFPQKPVMPGVIMIEAMAQTAGVVVLTSGAHNGKVALFMSISDVKFRKVVGPGDQLMMEVEIVRDRERTAHVKGVARVDGEVAIEADMMFSYTEAKYLNS